VRKVDYGSIYVDPENFMVIFGKGQGRTIVPFQSLLSRKGDMEDWQWRLVHREMEAWGEGQWVEKAQTVAERVRYLGKMAEATSRDYEGLSKSLGEATSIIRSGQVSETTVDPEDGFAAILQEVREGSSKVGGEWLTRLTLEITAIIRGKEEADSES